MAAGSRKKYALDLNDTFVFPDGDNIPLRPPDTDKGESWVMLLEVSLLGLTVRKFFKMLYFVFTLRKDKGLPFKFFRTDICDGRQHGQIVQRRDQYLKSISRYG